jgi:hypothetical protein
MLALIKLIRRYGIREGWQFWCIDRELDAWAASFDPEQ